MEGTESLEALLAPIAPYRRARAANWSYRFGPSSPDWVSLTIQLPMPVVLKVVQVTAHALSLASKLMTRVFMKNFPWDFVWLVHSLCLVLL